MNGNGGRWLFVVACIVAVAAIVQDYRFELSHGRLRASASNFSREASGLRVKIAELRGGQTAYLATGQGPEFWMRRVTDLAGEVESGIGRLKTEAQSAGTGTHLAAASSALTELLTIDKRARQAIDNDQRFLASDIVFAEGLTPAQTLVDSISSASQAETSAVEARLTRDGRLRLAMMPAALLVVIGAALVWVQTRKPKESPASAAAAMAQMLRDLPPPVKPAVSAAATPAPAPALPKPAPQPAPSVDLNNAAELCVDLARVLSGDDIPALLARASGVLNASGLVVWVSNHEGVALAPALWHGYSDKVIGKLGSLESSADNITSVCFRTGRPQAMPGVGQPGATSAIAVPLVTADGCHGVLSAELQIAKPPAEAVAVARIIAAQLASMTAAAAAGTAANSSAVATG